MASLYRQRPGAVSSGPVSLLIADDLKSPNEGTKMPAVKSLHQEIGQQLESDLQPTKSSRPVLKTA